MESQINVDAFNILIYVHSLVCQSIVMCSSPLDEYLPPSNEVWGKVIFLLVCVSRSVHRRGWGGSSLYDVTSCLSAWSHVPSV